MSGFIDPRSQFVGLERHVQAGGREAVTHANVASAHDDLEPRLAEPWSQLATGLRTTRTTGNGSAIPTTLMVGTG